MVRREAASAGGHVVLVGLMGAGKTTVGRQLAHALDLPFLDSDELIAARLGTTAAAIAERQGLDELHRIEVGLLLDGLASPEPSVIAAAASVIDDPRGRWALAAPSVRVVWLRAATDVLAQRTRGSAHRPLGTVDPERWLTAQDERRRRWFGAVADLTLDTVERPSRDLVAEVRAWLEQPAPPRTT